MRLREINESIDGPLIRSYVDRHGNTWWEVLDSRGTRISGQGSTGFSSLENAKELYKAKFGGKPRVVRQKGVAEDLNEMDKSAPQPGRDGKVSHSTYGSRDKKGSDYFKGKESPGKAITAKQASKDALDILKKQGVAEGKVVGHVGDVAGHGKIVKCAKCGADLRDDHGYALDNSTYVCRNGDKCSMRQSKNRLDAAAAKGQKPRWRKDEGVTEGLVGDVVVHNYTKMPIDLKPGQAQIHGWGPNDQPIYRVKGKDGKEVIISNKKKMMMVAQGKGVAEGSHDWSPNAKDAIKKDKIRSLENLISIYKEKGNGVKVKELQAELRSLKSTGESKLHNAIGKAIREVNSSNKQISEDRVAASKPSTLGGFKVNVLNIGGVSEALKLDAPQKGWSKQDMQDYLTRIKTGEKTKADRFKPIIHASNIKAITKDDGSTEWDLDDLANEITTKPKSILGANAKMSKSKKEGAITYDLTLPALSGIVVDEEASEAQGEPVFVEVTTCPGAGECQLYCYARKGGYVMFPNSSMSAARALNFLLNHPDSYMEMFNMEVKAAQRQADKAGIKLLVRIHDAGDFFSKEYYNKSMEVAADNPEARFYFYSKMGDIVTDTSAPPNVVKQFSPGAKSREVKTVKFARDAGKHVKDAYTLSKDFFRGLFKTDAKGKYIKDADGKTVVASPEAWESFKTKLADKYGVDRDSIITYDEMVKIPEGPKPKWNVVVFPAGHGDLGAPRLDVQNQFLMFH